MQNNSLIFITGNEKKFQEVSAWVPGITRMKLDLPEIQSLDREEVLRAKMDEARKCIDGPFFLDDTSLTFSCLGKMPGTLIKFFVQELGNDGMADLVHRYSDHAAESVCSIGYCDEQGEYHFFEGTMKGCIVKPTSSGVVGWWDVIFQPEGLTKTYDQMTTDEKNAISHRGKALRKLQEFLGR